MAERPTQPLEQLPAPFAARYPPAGAALGRYLNLQPLGQGGMGRVYRADDPKLHRAVALKLCLPTGHGQARFRERFQREITVLAQLHVDGIVRVFDWEECEGWCFYTMELIEGRPLARLLGDPAITPAERLRVLAQLGQTLAQLHAADICHRDLKPANILLTPAGKPVIVDFGLARSAAGDLPPTGETAAEMCVGTVGYLSPELPSELHASAAARAAADVFALGLVGYELLTQGQRAYQTAHLAPSEALAVLREEPPRPLTAPMPRAVRRLIMAMLRRDWQRRPSAAEVARRLRHWLPTAQPPGPLQRAGEALAAAGETVSGLLRRWPRQAPPPPRESAPCAPAPLPVPDGEAWQALAHDSTGAPLLLLRQCGKGRVVCAPPLDLPRDYRHTGEAPLAERDANVQFLRNLAKHFHATQAADVLATDLRQRTTIRQLIAAAGFELEDLPTLSELTPERLQLRRVLALFLDSQVQDPTWVLTPAQVQAVTHFVAHGGALYLSGRSCHAPLLAPLGLVPTGEDGTRSGMAWPLTGQVACRFVAHPLTQGLRELVGDVGARATFSGDWAVLGASLEREPLLAVREYGQGCVVYWYAQRSFRDPHPSRNTFETTIEAGDNRRFYANLFAWLQGRRPPDALLVGLAAPLAEPLRRCLRDFQLMATAIESPAALTADSLCAKRTVFLLEEPGADPPLLTADAAAALWHFVQAGGCLYLTASPAYAALLPRFGLAAAPTSPPRPWRELGAARLTPHALTVDVAALRGWQPLRLAAPA
jgi:hypothetical protein